MTDLQRIQYARVRDELITGIRRSIPELQARTTDDWTLALADGWALLAEIVGFHSARIREESAIDLATEIGSLIELSRLIGYRPDPGVAASTSLAFTIDDAGGAPVVPVPAGTAVTSVPGTGEQPVTFETIAPIEARPIWNQIRPQSSVLQQPNTSADTFTLLLAGTSTNVGPGDGILVPRGGPRDFGIVTAVHVRPDDPTIPGTPSRPGWTRVDVARLGAEDSVTDPVPVLSPDTSVAGGPLLDSMRAGGRTSITAQELQALSIDRGFDPADVFAALRASRAQPWQVVVFRAQSAIFGSTSPQKALLPASVQSVGAPDGASLDQYPGAKDAPNDVFCETVIPGARTGLAVVRNGANWRVVQVGRAAVQSLSVYAVSGRATRLTLKASVSGLSAYPIRTTTVFANGEWLPLAPLPVDDPITRQTGGSDPVLALDDWVEGLQAGQPVAITAGSATDPGTRIVLITQLSSVDHGLAPNGTTTITLAHPLPADLVRATVTINANVAPATHGESRSEVLGSGNGRDPLPRFAISGVPLTYISAAGGSVSTLRILVNGVQRPEADALLDPAEPGYVVRQDDAQRSTVQFGSPLPTGDVNVRAQYRVGLGAGAAVKAGQLTMLTRPPLGVRSVTNPQAAEGGADPESVADARVNAPVSVRALGRVVSLVDHADLARAFPGIAKATATVTTIGGRRGVCVTVAGSRGAAVSEGSGLQVALLGALRAGGDGLVSVRVASYQPVPFRLGAAVRISPDRGADDVLAAARDAVSAALGFAARDLGQPLAASEVVQILQRVPGVIAANVRVLCRLLDGAPESGVLYQRLLPAAPPTGTRGADPVVASLLVLDRSSLEVTEAPR